MYPAQKIIIASDADDLALKGAEFFFKGVDKERDEQGRFSMALSGGTTPRPMYRRFSRPPYATAVFWQNIHVFWVDERLVPHDHPDSNYGAARDDFLKRVPIPSDQLHPMPVDLSPDQGARRYEAALKTFFEDADGGPLFDLVYLGVGTDGHTASLFPGQNAAEETAAWVLSVIGGHPRLPRLTLTPPVLNRAKRIVFMVSGEDKAPILKTLWESSGASLPALKIRPLKGEVVWLVDGAAASLLPEEARSGSFPAKDIP